MLNFISPIADKIDGMRNLFRHASYIFTQTRPSERETIEAFLAVVTPALEKAATQYDYTMSVGQPDIVTRNANVMPPRAPARIRANFNIASETKIKLSFRHNKNPDDTREMIITVENNHMNNTVTYSTTEENTDDRSSYTNGRQPGPLDFRLANPKFHQSYTNTAKIASFITLASEEDLEKFAQGLREEVGKNQGRKAISSPSC